MLLWIFFSSFESPRTSKALFLQQVELYFSLLFGGFAVRPLRGVANFSITVYLWDTCCLYIRQSNKKKPLSKYRESNGRKQDTTSH